ncbi:hypothetical protein ACP70R_036604 [Stipagrostis hirtigluma subsp. patula]
MSGTPNAEADCEGFTCSALLMCLYLPGRSKKKPEEAAGTSRPPPETGAEDQPAEQEPAHAPSRAASLEKFECSSLYSSNNIVLDFVVEEGEDSRYHGAAAPTIAQGWCPSPCFDLPVELIRAGERCSAVAASDAPVTAAFVFGDYRRGSLKKMASCLASSVAAGEPAARQPHLVRFLSASGSSVPRPPVMPPRTAPKGTAVDGDGEFADGDSVQRYAVRRDNCLTLLHE